jgi:hypothetical protein
MQLEQLKTLLLWGLVMGVLGAACLPMLMAAGLFQ